MKFNGYWFWHPMSGFRGGLIVGVIFWIVVSFLHVLVA